MLWSRSESSVLTAWAWGSASWDPLPCSASCRLGDLVPCVKWGQYGPFQGGCEDKKKGRATIAPASVPPTVKLLCFPSSRHGSPGWGPRTPPARSLCPWPSCFPGAQGTVWTGTGLGTQVSDWRDRGPEPKAHPGCRIPGTGHQAASPLWILISHLIRRCGGFVPSIFLRSLHRTPRDLSTLASGGVGRSCHGRRG